MARYTVTLVFETDPWAVPRGLDVLDGVPLPERAVHRYSYCDGRTLTAIVDFRSARPAAVCKQAVESIRRRWSEMSAVAAGAPISVRVRPLRPPRPVAADDARPREYAWRPDGGPDGSLVLVDLGSEPISSLHHLAGPWSSGQAAHSSIAPPI